MVSWKNLTIGGVYGAEPDNAEKIIAWLDTFGCELLPYIVDTSDYLEDALSAGKTILFEAQLGALRDIDFGIYPYTSSSYTLASYGPIGAGIPGHAVDMTLGVMKAYSTCVGEGPFTAEMFGEEAEALRKAGGEYGAATGRPRRVGGFDVVASKYGVRVQGADRIALTKLDILSGWQKIPVCVAYEIDGKQTDRFPTGARLERAKPVYEYHDGWMQDISGCRSFDELPDKAKAYVEYLEKAMELSLIHI